jgi:chromosomal replication initiator protein
MTHLGATAQLWDRIRSNLLNKNPNNKTLGGWLNPVRFQGVIQKDHGPCLILEAPSELYKFHIQENLLDNIYIEARALHPAVSVEIRVRKTEKENSSSVHYQDLYGSVALSQGNDQENIVSSKLDSHSPGFSVSHSSQSAEFSYSSHPSVTLSQNSRDSRSFSSSGKRKNDFLDPHFTFSNFVVGRNSEFAHAACYNVARNPGQGGYNPLLICGPVGMGKTHLLHAVGHEIAQNNPEAKIVYLQAEKFLNEFISAMRNKKTEDFRTKYRDHVDVLLFDDTQFIGKGEATQDEFFHIFNSLIDKKKQIILASDRKPKDILNLEDRNRSRLEWGLTVDITMPDYETRVAILRYQAEQLKMKLSEDVIVYIAKVSKRSIREIEGNLKTLKMFSELQGLAIDLSLTKNILNSQESQPTISVDDILKLVCQHFKLTLGDLKSSSRAKMVVVPRQIGMYLVKKYLDRSFVEIGKHFGNRDHTTVINAVERVRYLQTQNLDIRNDIEELTAEIHKSTGV